MKRIALFIMTVLLIGTSAMASVSPTIQVQGILTDDTGNPLPDGNYSVDVKIYKSPTYDGYFYGGRMTIVQQDGIFSLELPSLNPNLFEDDTWLELQIVGEPAMTPRIPIKPVPVALRASTVDTTGAVITLNGKAGNVTLVAGTNVTIDPSPTTNQITINADGTGGGGDTDWAINGDDITHAPGRVFVGSSLAKANAGGDKSAGWPANSKMEVQGLNEGFSAYMEEDDAASDGRAAIFGMRRTTTRNHGTGIGADNSNAAITGYNHYGESYTWGISGYTRFNYRNTGAVLGSTSLGETWAALAFQDNDTNHWGLFTPSNIHTDGMTETSTLRVTTGAAPGYLMTSDAAGNASWAPPAAAGSDGDWDVSGENLTHSGSGTVAIGTGAPSAHGNDSSRTTFQIFSSFSPALALDAWFLGNLKRWTIAQDSGDLHFNRSTTYASLGTTALALSENNAEFTDPGGTGRINLQTNAPEETGAVIYMYGNATTTSTLVLDAQVGSGGGNIKVRDGNGNDEVTITGNHMNTGVGRVTTPVLEITGGADLSEQFDLGNAAGLTEPGMVVSIDPDNPGRLTLSEKAYDRRVAGVVSGAGGVNTGMVMGQSGSVADGDHPVALVGRVYVWADASSGPIEPGDLLTTSDLPGHAMKVEDHDLATGAILGKAMTGLTEGRGLILTLVTLQ